MIDSHFNTGDPLAYFITWTTYGTWLPGDDRGWHDWGKGGIRPPNQQLQKYASGKSKETPFLMASEDREVVEQTIENHCKFRNWIAHAVNARTNHVHAVVTAPSTTPETVRDQLKAWCSRKLKHRHPERIRFWTEGASRRYINSEDDLALSVAYVLEAQDNKDLEDRHSGD